MSVRALGVGLSYAAGNSLFGGTAEYVALWFRHREMETPSISALSAVAFVTALAMGRRYDENRLV